MMDRSSDTRYAEVLTSSINLYVLLKALPPVCMKYTARVEWQI